MSSSCAKGDFRDGLLLLSSSWAPAMTNQPNCHHASTLSPGPRGFGTISWYRISLNRKQEQSTWLIASCFFCCQTPVSCTPLPLFLRFTPPSLSIRCAADSLLSPRSWVYSLGLTGMQDLYVSLLKPSVSAICPWWFSFRLGSNRPFYILQQVENCSLLDIEKKMCPYPVFP